MCSDKMVSISDPSFLSKLHFGLSFKRRSLHAVLNADLGRKRCFEHLRDRACSIDSCGNQRTFSCLAVVGHHKSHYVGSEHIDAFLLQGYGQSKGLKRSVNKLRVIPMSHTRRPSELEAQELNSPSKWKGLLPCSSLSEGSALNGSTKLDSHMEGELLSDSLKDRQPVSSSLEKSPHFCVNEEHINGRSGFASFYRNENFGMENTDFGSIKSSPTKKTQSLLWLVAPVTLVASVVIPPILFRQLVEKVLDDTLVTDFVILFFTEAAFYVGVYILLYIAKMFSIQVHPQKPEWSLAVHFRGYKVSSLICLATSVILPTLTTYLVWPWIGPAAAATFVPFMVGLLVQFWFEESMKGSPILPHVEIIFQVYRLHQLNRAAQLAAGLLFSLKGIESTAETLAINGALQTLMTVLQLLGIICLWSFGSFLVQTAFMHQTITRS